MTLLSIVQNASDEVGISRPNSVIANTDSSVRQMLALLNREGKNLTKARNTWGGGWTILERVHTFTTVSGQDEYDLPDDFGALIADTVWDRASFFEMRGPLSPSQWQAIRSGLSASPALRRRYRIRRGLTEAARKFNIDPTPTATGETQVFEYTSRNWVLSGSTPVTAFQDDSDTTLFDEDLLEMGLIWRFLSRKGFSFATEIAVYEQQRDQRLANDAGNTKIPLARDRFRLPPANTPETGFGT